MPILSNYLEDMDELKEKIQNESNVILEAIDLNHLLSLSKDDKIEYVKDLLFDFWEIQEDEIKKAMKMGEDKAKNILRQI